MNFISPLFHLIKAPFFRNNTPVRTRSPLFQAYLNAQKGAKCVISNIMESENEQSNASNIFIFGKNEAI